MRVLIVGGGALGTVMAGYLAHAGNQVTLFVKPAQAAAFPAPEVHLTGIANLRAPVRLASGPEGIGAFDALIVCVKGRDTEAALAPLRGVEAESVLSLQNGVKKDETLAQLFGGERVLGAVAIVSGELQGPGTVLNTAAAGVWLGELDGSPSPRGERLAAVLQEAGIPGFCVPDIRRREWDKLAFYLSAGLVGAATRLDTVTLVFDPDLCRVAIRVAMDVAAVARAEGFPLDVTEAGYRATLETFAQPVRDRGVVHYMSLTQDLMAGRPTELEATAGDVLARAGRHGLAVPTLETCTNLLRGIEQLAASRERSAPLVH